MDKRTMASMSSRVDSIKHFIERRLSFSRNETMKRRRRMKWGLALDESGEGDAKVE